MHRGPPAPYIFCAFLQHSGEVAQNGCKTRPLVVGLVIFAKGNL
ncbi:hypothetical protein Z947_1276 [Sulfitobacter geojensis]|nr:hypothetical protein Z947_1276 [Sulfitobacter geojensis]